MILSREMLHAAATNYNGFNRAQLDLIGVKWPPAKGWLSALEGRFIEDEKWHQVMALSGVRKKRRGN